MSSYFSVAPLRVKQEEATLASPSRSGVFEKATDRRVEQFTESISFDRRLYAQDIEASIAHAQMLATCGILDAGEVEQIEQALKKIRERIEEGRFETHVASI